MVLVLCLTLLPTAAFAEGEDVSISGGVIGGGETGGEGGGIYVAPGSPTKGGGGTYIPGEDTRTEIRCVSKPDSIGRSYDGTTDGGTTPIDLTFTDGTNEIKLKEGTGFTAKKTFDSADAGWHTVTVEIALIGEAAVKYKLKAGEETFTIGGNINKAYPDLKGLSRSDRNSFQDSLHGGRKDSAAAVCQRRTGKCRGNILLYPDQSWIFGV